MQEPTITAVFLHMKHVRMISKYPLTMNNKVFDGIENIRLHPFSIFYVESQTNHHYWQCQWYDSLHNQTGPSLIKVSKVSYFINCPVMYPPITGFWGSACVKGKSLVHLSFGQKLICLCHPRSASSVAVSVNQVFNVEMFPFSFAFLHRQHLETLTIWLSWTCYSLENLKVKINFCQPNI